jgi:hypothetical protein
MPTTKERGVGMSGGIPTTYVNIRFRSRLEAQWAAFFDLLSWPWEYEPSDLRGYIPDFILKFDQSKWNDYGPLLVEVKSESSIEALVAHSEKIIKSGWEGHACIVGSSLLTSQYEWPSIGHGIYWSPPPIKSEDRERYIETFGDYYMEGFNRKKEPQPWSIPNYGVLSRCWFCRRIIIEIADVSWCCFCHRDIGYQGIHEQPQPHGSPSDGNGIWWAYEKPDVGLIQAMWATAKNRVQWKGEYGA